MCIEPQGLLRQGSIHGGTCLRILHGLDRFSEDLDFTLREKDLDFDFQPYADALVESLKKTGLSATTSLRKPLADRTICSAKIKIDFCEVLKISGFTKDLIQRARSKALIVIKIDIDLDSPEYSKEEIVRKTKPLEYGVRSEPLPVLFAGKVAAALYRQWNNRVNGRDMYDFRWYIEHDIPIDLACLESRLDKKCDSVEGLDREKLVEMLKKRFDELNWTSAEDDVINFIQPSQLREWGSEPFKNLAERIKVLEE